MKHLKFRFILCLFFGCLLNPVFAQMKYNDDLKKSTMTTEEAME